MIYSFANQHDIREIGGLLERCGLPSNDLEAHLNHFIVAKREDSLVGCIGMEIQGPLLRSLAVDPAERNHGIANELTQRLLAFAKARGASEIYLLTETASMFFEKLGFQRINRENAPPNIRSHQQFTELCPSSAILMRKEL
jgi:amino-acid N-acetyltransferase